MSRIVFEELRAAVEAVERARSGEVSSAIWKAFGADGLTEAEASELQGLLDARIQAARAVPRPRPPELARATAEIVAALGIAETPAAPPPAPTTPRPARRVGRTGSRPRRPQDLSFRRTWVARGYLPPALASRFTQGEAAALAVIAAEVVARGVCLLAIGQIAARAGVGPSTVKRALKAARLALLIKVEERKVAWNRHDTNVVRVVSAEWSAWLARRAPASRRPGVGSKPESESVREVTVSPQAARIRAASRRMTESESPPERRRAG